MELKGKKPESGNVGAHAPAARWAGQKKEAPASRKILAINVSAKGEREAQALCLECALGRMGMDAECGSVESFGNFLSGAAGMRADILVVESANAFGNSAERRRELESAIKQFRRSNPRAHVTVCVMGREYRQEAEGWQSSGLVDFVFTNTFALNEEAVLGKALEAPERQARKAVVFVVEDADVRTYSITHKHIFQDVGADAERSRVAGISEFLADPAAAAADVLVVDPIRKFSMVPGLGGAPDSPAPLRRALAKYREGNPDAYVAVRAFDYSQGLGDLVQSGVINELDGHSISVNEREKLRGMLQKLGSA